MKRSVELQHGSLVGKTIHAGSRRNKTIKPIQTVSMQETDVLCTVLFKQTVTPLSILSPGCRRSRM